MCMRLHLLHKHAIQLMEVRHRPQHSHYIIRSKFKSVVSPGFAGYHTRIKHICHHPGENRRIIPHCGSYGSLTDLPTLASAVIVVLREIEKKSRKRRRVAGCYHPECQLTWWFIDGGWMLEQVNPLSAKHGTCVDLSQGY